MPLSARPDGMSEALRGSFAIQSAKGVIAKVWWPFPTLMATEVTGYLDVSTAHFLAESLRQHAVAPTRIVGFHDWANVSDYESAATHHPDECRA